MTPIPNTQISTAEQLLPAPKPYASKVSKENNLDTETAIEHPVNREPEIETSHMFREEATSIGIYGIKVSRNMYPYDKHRVLEMLFNNTKARFPFDIFNTCVSFLDHEDRDACVKKLGYLRNHSKYLNTIQGLLKFVKANATINRGILFAFAEVGGWTGIDDGDELLKGHLWGGMLIKKEQWEESSAEEWCFNIYCTADLALDAAGYLNIGAGRAKLWAALHDAGIRVTEVNMSRTLVTPVKETCVINTMYWLYMASKMNGHPWKLNDPRKIALRLHTLVAGEDLFNLHNPPSVQAKKRRPPTDPWHYHQVDCSYP